MFIGNIKIYKVLVLLGKEKIMMTTQAKEKLNTRKDFYKNRDTLQMNSSILKAKDSDLPFLNKKALFVYNRLSSNDINKEFSYSLESLTNDYRKEVEKIATSKSKKPNEYKFRKSFKSSEVVDIATIKSVIQYFYIVNERLFEYYRNSKGNYLIREIGYTSNLATLKDRK